MLVADDCAENATTRIRGWGRIQYLPNAEELQDDVGKLIAELLTEHWPKSRQSPGQNAANVCRRMMRNCIFLKLGQIAGRS